MQWAKAWIVENLLGAFFGKESPVPPHTAKRDRVNQVGYKCLRSSLYTPI